MTLATLSVSLMLLYGATQESPLQQRLRKHIELLASEEFAGRYAGSEGGYMAGDYIAEQFGSLGLKTFERASYFHPFTTMLEDGVFRNVVARIEGTLRDSYIIIGAHYDHLGLNRKGAVCYGADDNASGAAVLLEVARLLTEVDYKPTHTLIFAAFDAEELGLYGSKDLAERFAEGSIKAMLNMDMVGRLGDERLQIEGIGTLEGVEEVIVAASEKHALATATRGFEWMPMVATDTEAFAQRGAPTLSLTTGLHGDYHKPSDTTDKIDYRGLEQITLFVGELTRAIDTNREVVSSGKVARKHRTGVNDFEVGVVYAFGNNHYRFPDTAYQGREAGAWSLGCNAIYSLKYIALRVGAHFNRQKALVPSGDELMSKAETIYHDYLTIPCEVLLKTKGRTSALLSLGAFYSLSLRSTIRGVEQESEAIGKTPYEWGLQWGLGGRIGSLFVEATNRYSLSPVYNTSPRTLNRTTLCTLGWWF